MSYADNWPNGNFPLLPSIINGTVPKIYYNVTGVCQGTYGTFGKDFCAVGHLQFSLI
jgi:hypothetical protein